MSTALPGFTVAEYKAKLPVELGDTTGILEANMDLLWREHEGFGSRKDPDSGNTVHNYYLQYLYVKMECIEILIGNLDEKLSYPVIGGRDRRVERRLRILESKLERTRKQIVGLGWPLRVRVGTLDLVKPVNRGVGYPPDPRDPYYGPGDVTVPLKNNIF